VSRHHDKLIEQLTAPEPRAQRTEPRTHGEIESFVKGFGLSAAATRQLVSAWTEDVGRAWNQGYAQGDEEARWNG
jgi:hypothetical protein